jgi:phosphotransferase system HPr (HPr) family protein
MRATTIEREVEVTGELGLHARPAAEFAKAAGRYTSDIRIAKGDREVDAKSVLLVLTLDVRRGDRVRLRAEGPDTARALDELARLVTAP